MKEGISARLECHRRVQDAVALSLSAWPDGEEVRVLLHECQRIAYAYLLQKRRRETLVPALSERSIEAIAFHCCGSLFESNGQGRYDQLEAFFEQSGWRQLSKEEAHMALRRLIFSLVNQYLFRQSLQEEPDLSVLREQIKQEARAVSELSIQHDREEEWLVAAGLAAGRDALPIAPVEVLQVHFAAALRSRCDLQRLLQVFLTFLEEQRYYMCGYPLAGLAWVLHSASVCTGVDLPKGRPPGR